MKRTQEDVDSTEGAGRERGVSAEPLCNCIPEQALNLQPVARRGSRTEEC